MTSTPAQQRLYAIRFGGILTIAGLVILIDRLTKTWVLNHFNLWDSQRITSFFYFTYVQNTGSAFGLFQNNNRALLVVAFLIMAGLLYAARGLCERGGWWASVGVALVLGGALGNMIDRIHYGRVIDFLDFRVWPVFNVADSSITIGTVSLALSLWNRRMDA